MKASAVILLGIIAVAFASPRCIPGQSGLIEHAQCNKFYLCIHGLLIEGKCPLNLVFNPESLQCDFPKNVNCVKEDDNDNEPTYDPILAPAICAEENSDGVLVSHENCNKFYICANNKPVEMQCYGDLYFNPYNGQCDWQENVDCVSSVEVENDKVEEEKPVYDDPSMAPAICAEKGSNGILVSHEKCNFFYKCAHGLPVARECPSNLLFNPELEVCDWPKNVNCVRNP